MLQFEQQLSRVCQGRVCLMGIGNVDLGDDGFGVRLAEAIGQERMPRVEVMIAGTSPERYAGRARDRGWDNLIFLDAVNFGAEPGAVVLLDSAEMVAHFPQVSTHKISLGLLAQCVESGSPARVWLLGVQPASLVPGAGLSLPMSRALARVAQALRAARGRSVAPLVIA